jgi:hypothetical protein
VSTDLRIRTRATRVAVVLRSGAELVGDVFLHRECGVHDGDETLVDLMNDASAFFPLRTGDAGPSTMLVAKAHVRYLRVAPPLGDERMTAARATAPRVEIQLELEGGESLAGVVYADFAPGKRRTLDILNAATERFLVVAQAESDCLVRRDAIVSARDRGEEGEAPLA